MMLKPISLTTLSLFFSLAGSMSLQAQSLHTVPAVKHWTPSQGKSLHLKTSRIFINPQDAKKILPVAKLLASELANNTEVVQSSNLAKRVINLKIDPNIKGEEKYRIDTTFEGLTISAKTSKGIFYGTRTVLQLLQQGDIPLGTIEDAPRYPIRSVLVDVGRKFMPVPKLKDWIRIMAWLKINELHLHLNDNSWGRYPGYRLESKKFPGLSSKDGYYSFKEIRELQDFAKLRGVSIVPEIDSPGHALAFTTLRPNLAQKEMNRNGFGIAYLDLANPDAIKFMEDLWDEVCPLFDSPIVHIGTDEYRVNLIKDPKKRKEMGERFRKYINHLNAYITKKHGKIVRTWSGYEYLPGTTEPDTSIIIDMWETSDAKSKVKAGYKVVNSSHLYTYIVPGAPYYGVNNSFIYNTWTPMQFSNKPAGMLSPEDPGLLGAKLHVWNDFGPSGYTWNEIIRLTLPSMAAISEKMWGVKGAKNYNEFLTYSPKLTSSIPKVKLLQRDAVLQSPNHHSDLIWNLKKPITLIPNNNPKLNLPIENLEWPWTMSVTLTRYNDLAGDEVLLSSKLAAFYLDLSHTTFDKKKKKNITRRGVACVRANQNYGYTPLTSHNPDILIFNYTVPTHKKVTLTFVGEKEKTSLYANGKLIQIIHKQMVCPLTRIGTDLPHGIHATIHNMTIKSSALKATPVGIWKKGKVSTTPTPVTIDISKAIQSNGNYTALFQYTGGAHRMDIDQVELLKNGKVIATDNHKASTGSQNLNNTYKLPIKNYQKGSNYQIRAIMHSDGGTDSQGTITILPMP